MSDDLNLTIAAEDYLKSIYELTRVDGRATTNQIAERLGVTQASATGMIQRLASNDPPLVEYAKHRGVLLTVDGKRAALEVIRHHRLLEKFLVETLGYTWDQVHTEAEHLEHVISEDLEERIAQAMGNPDRDPHGQPIPDRDLQIPPQSAIRLGDLRAGQKAVIQSVADTCPEFLRYLSSIGLIPQAHVTILDYSPFDDNICLQVNGQLESVVLGPRVTSQIFVEVS
jgi:DtxR family Mn-dependent transcriptional regulator